MNGMTKVIYKQIISNQSSITLNENIQFHLFLFVILLLLFFYQIDYVFLDLSHNKCGGSILIRVALVEMNLNNVITCKYLICGLTYFQFIPFIFPQSLELRTNG